MGVIYSFEAATPLGDQLDRITLFRGLGVRVMQLCYNRKTPFGVGCLDGETGGLTELGRQAITTMNQLGVAVDLSHANTQTTAEGIAASKQAAGDYPCRLPRRLHAPTQQRRSRAEGAWPTKEA